MGFIRLFYTPLKNLWTYAYRNDVTLRQVEIYAIFFFWLNIYHMFFLVLFNILYFPIKIIL